MGKDASLERQKLISLVQDEANRSAIRKALESGERKSAFRGLSRHPVVVLVVGFLLTWGNRHRPLRSLG